MYSVLNLPGADLNNQRLARRAEYMDVFCNPAFYVTGCLPPQAWRAFYGCQYVSWIWLNALL